MTMVHFLRAIVLSVRIVVVDITANSCESSFRVLSIYAQWHNHNVLLSRLTHFAPASEDNTPVTIKVGNPA